MVECPHLILQNLNIHTAAQFFGRFFRLPAQLVTMCKTFLGQNHPQFAGKIRTLPMDIADPYGGDIAVYRQCLAQLRYALQVYCAEGAE